MARVSKYGEHRDQLIGMIAKAAESHARPPSVRQLAAEVGVGVATMHSYLERLSDEGVVEWSPGKHRSLKLSPTATQQL